MTATIIKPKTALERVLEFVTTEKRVAEIEAALKPDYQRSAVEKALAEAIKLGHLTLVKRGLYRPVSLLPTQPVQQSFMEHTEGTETEARKPETDAEKPFPYFPYPPMASTESTETVNGNKRITLAAVSQKGRKATVRKGNGAIPYPPTVSSEDKEVF